MPFPSPQCSNDGGVPRLRCAPRGMTTLREQRGNCGESVKPAGWLWRMLARDIQSVAYVAWVAWVAFDHCDRRITVTETTLQPQAAGAPRVPIGRIALFGLLAIVLSIVANYLLLTLVVNLLGLPEFGPLNPVLVAQQWVLELPFYSIWMQTPANNHCLQW